ncbi:MAG: sialidase family protein [Kiritimatiellales bacterium]
MICRKNGLRMGLLSAVFQLVVCNSILAGDRVAGKTAGAGNSNRTYSVYQPEISDHVIVGFNQQGIKYRHVAGLEYFKGRFYAAFNANTVFSEAQPGQECYVAWSKDGKTWSDAVQFTPKTSVPGGKYEKNNIQWQGGLFNWKNEELWCFWSEEPNSALHLSVLKDPDGKWTDRIIQRGVAIDGTTEYMPFACNNPIRLPAGRIMLPIIVQDFASHKFNVNPVKWQEIKKYSVALVSDDEGKTWRIEEGTLIKTDPPADPYGNAFTGVWEPMYVLQADGRVRAFTRTAGNRLFTAVGDKDGTTMGLWEKSSTRTLQSRHWIGQYGARRLMVHHDDYRKEVNWRDRRNLALFFSRAGEDDFVAGNSIVGRDVQVQYPQALVHDDKLYVAYTYDAGHELRCAIVNPLPKESDYYIFPRGDQRGMGDFEDAQPEGRTEVSVENGREMLRMRGNAAAGVDVDAVNPETDTLEIGFPVKIENTEHRKMIRLASIGDGQIMLGYSKETPDRLNICINGKWQDAGPFGFESWHRVKLSVNKKRILVDVDDQTKEFLPASGFSGRVYMGDGYPAERLFGQSRYVIDISGITTRVLSNM